MGPYKIFSWLLFVALVGFGIFFVTRIHKAESGTGAPVLGAMGILEKGKMIAAAAFVIPTLNLVFAYRSDILSFMRK